MEAEFLEWLRSACTNTHPAVTFGIGDDAAVLSPTGSGGLIVTSDMLMDGTDFHVAEHAPERIGRKAVAVNLSDIAAMGAAPSAIFVSVALPRPGALALAKALYRGILKICRDFDVALAGGDTNTWDGPLVISVTACGRPHPKGVLPRSGARPGDAIVVTGEFGGSLLGRHFDFTPRVREVAALWDGFELHAATDVSDGLTLDLHHLATASGCGFEIQAKDVPVSPAAHEQARQDGRSPLEHALADGEDLEVILSVPASEIDNLPKTIHGVPLTRIGSFLPDGRTVIVDRDGCVKPCLPAGYQH